MYTLLMNCLVSLRHIIISLASITYKPQSDVIPSFVAHHLTNRHRCKLYILMIYDAVLHCIVCNVHLLVCLL